jgi:hypothetical protein
MIASVATSQNWKRKKREKKRKTWCNQLLLTGKFVGIFL